MPPECLQSCSEMAFTVYRVPKKKQICIDHLTGQTDRLSSTVVSGRCIFSAAVHNCAIAPGAIMTPADKRVMDLLDRWLISVELHLKYADLDDVSYQQMQPWPKHERPARWVLELAQQKVLSLQSLCKARLGDNDPSFAESLELMCFLANLVGAQHIQRFIPVASPEREAKPDTGMHRALQTGTMAARTPVPTLTPATAAPTVTAVNSPAAAPVHVAPTSPPAAPAVRAVAAPAPQFIPAKPAAVPAQPVQQAAKPVAAPVAVPTLHSAEDGDHTREMPRLRATRQRLPVKNMEPRRLHVRGVGPAVAKVAKAPEDNAQLNEVVIADAVRLLKWGRQWHEIAELISRMAERPGIAEVRKILRSHKPAIEQQLEA